MTDENKKISEFKFEKLEIWQLSLDYVDLCYATVDARQPEFRTSESGLRDW
jgi:hypothetical protein